MKSLPRFVQAFVSGPSDMHVHQLELSLFKARREAEKKIWGMGDRDFYVTHLSARVLIYKGLVLPENLPVFYPDLSDARLESSICVFHQRFSTNTLPRWRLAHPFRYVAHNGEINTISGNRYWALARAPKFRSPDLADIRAISPLVGQQGSDSESLDNMFEVLLAGGKDPFSALRALIPPAWQNVDDMDPDLRAFYEYNSLQMEPWDGPAGIVATDGRYAICGTDRNGLSADPLRHHPRPPYRTGLGNRRHRTSPPSRWWKRAACAQDSCWRSTPTTARCCGWPRSTAPWPRANLTRPGSGTASAVSKPASTTTLLAPETMHPETVLVYQKLFGLSAEERDQVVRVLAESGGRDHRQHGRRHALRRALAPRALAVRLFPPAVRAGHQPAHRPAARADRHEPRMLAGRRARDVRGNPRAGPAPAGGFTSALGGEVQQVAGPRTTRPMPTSA